MTKKKIIFISIILILILFINYINLITNTKDYYKKVYFPELYIDLEKSENYKYLFSYRKEFGIFGTLFLIFIKNQNGYYKLNRKSHFTLTDDSVYFGVGGLGEVKKYEYYYYTVYPNGSTQWFYDSLPGDMKFDNLQKGFFYRYNNKKFEKMSQLNNSKLDYSELKSGYYLLSYPGFFYDTVMNVQSLK